MVSTRLTSALFLALLSSPAFALPAAIRPRDTTGLTPTNIKMSGRYHLRSFPGQTATETVDATSQATSNSEAPSFATSVISTSSTSGANSLSISSSEPSSSPASPGSSSSAVADLGSSASSSSPSTSFSTSTSASSSAPTRNSLPMDIVASSSSAEAKSSGSLTTIGGDVFSRVEPLKVESSTTSSSAATPTAKYVAPVDKNSSAPVFVPWQACPSDSIFLASYNGTGEAANTTAIGFPTKEFSGTVNSVSIFPCERALPDEPCRFRYGANYTISVNFTSSVNASRPLSTMLARDDTVVPSDRYPYSGQSFNGCAYTGCAIEANVTQLYNYTLETLLSPFNHLSVSLVPAMDQPPIFCAGFAAQYIGPAGEEMTVGEELLGLFE